MNQKQPFQHKPFVVLGWKISSLGVTAEIACYSLNESDSTGQEVYRDTVKLHDGKQRLKFAKAFFNKLPGQSLDKRDEFVASREEELRKIENTCRHIDREANAPKLTATAPAKQPPPTDDERNKALVLLQDPALLFNVLLTAKQSGIVGEEKNLLTLYLVMTSRLLPQPLSAATKGESSAGKSALDETIRRFFPKDEAYYFWSAMSGKTLFYTEKDFKHKMLVIAEANGSEDASYSIRTLLSEHRLTYEVVEKDERTGQSHTRQIEKEGPTGFLTTTTLPRLHPENETRLITLAIDESEEQTRSIMKSIAAKYKNGGHEIDFTSWINAQRILQPLDVEIPYAEFLVQRLPTKPLRIRRDCRKLLSLIAASAVLHQFQRGRNPNGKVVANLADYYNAKVLFEDIFFQSLYGVHPNTQALMDAITKLSANMAEEVSIITRALMDELGWAKSKISKWAKPLHDYGWVTYQGRGKENIYQVGQPITDQHAALPSLEEMAEQFPELVVNFSVVHPITGVNVRLQAQGDDETSAIGVASVSPAALETGKSSETLFSLIE
jgi:hypothetical protein